MNKKKIIRKILKINSIYDINFLKSCSEDFLQKLLIDNMIVSQGYGNTLFRNFK